MKPRLLIRIAAGLLLFFAMGHSIGHFSRHDIQDDGAQKILQEMKEYRFDMFGNECTYDGQYTGMSLNLIFTLITFAVVLWTLSSLSTPPLRRLLIPFAVCSFLFSITSFLFFFPVPGITCLLAGIFLVLAIIRLGKSATT